jgi:hypothetical protein
LTRYRTGRASTPGLVTPNGKLSGQTLSSALPAPVTLGLTAGALGLSPGTDADAPTARAGALAGKPAAAEVFSAFSTAVVGDPSAAPSSSTAAKDALFAGADHGSLLSDLGDSLSRTPDYGMTPS